MLPELSAIILYQGATSIIEIDLSSWNMEGKSCIFTVRNLTRNEVFKEIEFTTAEKHLVTFMANETLKLLENNRYGYDVMMVIGQERFPQSKISIVKVERVAGEYYV